MNYKAIPMIFLLSMTLLLSGQTPERIEPPGWWIGMKDPSLQIMVYGKGIGSFKAKTTYPGITITKSTCPENLDYLFIDLVISPKTLDGNIPIDLFESETRMTSFMYPLYKRNEGSSDRKGFTNKDVIYLLMPDRFANGDRSNDNLPGMMEQSNRSDDLGRHGGDLAGIIDHLDYIANMGFTSIWLNPVLENNMPRHSYHGYATTDFYKVDPRYGTNETYKTLCTKASEKGIGIIMDMIANHCGLHHWWMENPPTRDWINYYQSEYKETNHRKSLSMDPHASAEDAEELIKGWFVRTMPDLNTSNPFMATYLIQNAIWWIEYAGLSGIRMDTYLYPDEAFMSDWAEKIMKEYPKFNIAGEVWHDDPAIVSYWQKGKRNANGYESNLPALFDFPIQDALRKSLMSDGGWEDGWMPLYEELAHDAQYPDPMNLVVFADNHDMSRIFTQLEENYMKFQLAMTYIATMRGIPQIFYGTEILMTNEGTDNHGVIRSDFPGGWAGDTANAFTGKDLVEQQKEAQDFLKKLLQWRKGANVLHTGRTMHYIPKEGVYVFFRYNDEEKIMIILNKNESPVTLQPKRFASMLHECQWGKDILSGERINLRVPIVMSKPGPMVIEVETED